MPNLDQAKKAVRQSAARRVVNDKRRRAMRESVKDVVVALKKSNTGTATEKLSRAFQALDKAAKRGVIKSGTADRRKSRLAKAIQRATV
jgi:small subunit ribosomal protein S20